MNDTRNTTSTESATRSNSAGPLSDATSPDEFAQGRKAPFTMLGDWVAVSGVDPQARALYWDIKSHVNESNGNGTAWPPRDFLALLAGAKQARTMDPYLRQLEAINAISAQRERSVAKMRARNKYKVHDTPPRGWDGPTSHTDVWAWLRDDEAGCKAYYEARRAWLKDVEAVFARIRLEEKKAGAKASAAVSREGHRAWLKECSALWVERWRGSAWSERSAVERTTAVTEAEAPSGGTEPRNSGSAVERTTWCGTAHLGSAVERTETTSKGNNKKGAPPSARSAPDARRATTGSRGSSSSGSAASGNKKPITTTQRAQVQAVRDLLPPLLARDLPDETPTNISKKILAALDTDGPRPRTPEQLAAYRINPRWDGYWATQYGDDGFDKPLGVVLALVASQAECGNVRCDDRRDVDTGELCPFCVELKADRRVQRRLEQQDAVRAAERPSEPLGGRSGDVVPPPRPEVASWAPAAPGAWPTVVTPAEDTPVVSTVEIPSPDEVQARTADMRSILRDRRSRPSRAPF